MYRTSKSLSPARRSAAAIGATVALAAGALAVAPAARAGEPAPGHASRAGASTATVLRAGLDVSLLHKTVDVPVHVSLNDVHAPASAKETALTVTVGHGVQQGRPVNILRAAVATADATVDQRTAEGYANIANAQLHVPGLPLLSLVKLDAISSRATCTAGRRPTASSHLAGVTVLGRRVALDAVGATQVVAPGVGTVELQLTDTVRTSRTAAATALHLQVHVNPLNLGVAGVSGDVTLAQATCRTPQGSTGGSTAGATSGSSGGSDNGGSTDGGSSTGGSTSGGSDNGGSTDGGSSTGGSTSGGSGNGGATSGGASNGNSSGGSNGASAGGSTSGGSSAGGSSTGGSGGDGGTHPQSVADSGNLAATGASSSTPYLAGGAAALVVAGAAVYLITNRRKRAAAHGDR